METSSIYLGVIIVAIILLLAVVTWRAVRRRKGRGRDGFTYGTPATPRIREAAGDLYANLKYLVVLGRSFEAQAAAQADATPLAGARLSAAQLVSSLDNAGKAIWGAPPSYANYLAVYRGLAGADAAFRDAADAYAHSGHEVHQGIVLAPAGAPTGEQAALGGTLIAMGAQLRLVQASVHRLGVALDVE